jgi:membrane protease YdiL (CAAX protease family)
VGRSPPSSFPSGGSAPSQKASTGTSPVAVRWCLLLAGLGLVTGLAITLAGNFLPMPKAPPILEDLTKSAAGAWALTVFGVTLAPLTEELAFRGFLLPSLVNIFRWLERKNIIGDSVVRTIGIPLSIVLTSIPFAFMHAAQVSNSWGPVLLIGLVSVILCIVRLTTDSVAAGVVVHACYNFTLFAGLLYQTDWYRHLDKLKG